ncbi:MAG TPA: N-acetylglucosamine-6-phosphate deacetylase [Gaiella sp.]|nr:N-acetylglucosamine-6-phosphate deacetylase [Gaiella sp.]
MRLGVEAALVDGTFVPGDVAVDGGMITAVGLDGAGHGIAAPGFVDLQVNGFAGIDFLGADADGFATAGDALLETGVTAYLPTLITSPEADVVAALRSVPATCGGPRILGVHLEGPFLSPARLGTHGLGSRRDPDPALLDRLLAAGPVRLMTLAPELPGALDLVGLLLARGVTVAAGHTDATAAEANAAFDRGVRTVTHVFNAMRPLAHRDPGIVGAALVRHDVVLQAIVDGVHLDPEIVRLLWAVGEDRLALVTDATAGAALGDGTYALGEIEITVTGDVVRREDGVLAGSALTMPQALRNLVAAGVPLERALEAASAVPARVLGIPGLGRLVPGGPADVTVIDDRLEVVRAIVGGETRVAG